MSTKQDELQVRALFKGGVCLHGNTNDVLLKITSIDDTSCDPVTVAGADQPRWGGRYGFGEVLEYFDPVLEAGQVWNAGDWQAVILAVTDEMVLWRWDGKCDEHSIADFRRVFCEGFIGAQRIDSEAAAAAKRWLAQQQIADERIAEQVADDPIPYDLGPKAQETYAEPTEELAPDMLLRAHLPKALDSVTDRLRASRFGESHGYARQMADGVRAAMDLRGGGYLDHTQFSKVVQEGGEALARCETVLGVSAFGDRASAAAVIAGLADRLRNGVLTIEAVLNQRLHPKPLPPPTPPPPDPVCIDNSFWQDGAW